VFDVVRAAALVWAIVAATRVRARWEWPLLALVGYVFALELVSGFTIRAEGPLVPMLALLLIFLGPSSMPRGALPAVPLAAAVVHWPVVVGAASAGALALASRLVTARARAQPEHSDLYPRTHALALALTLLAALDGILVVARVLPWIVGGDLGDGRVDAE
jgi:hypothetical protein